MFCSMTRSVKTRCGVWCWPRRRPSRTLLSAAKGGPGQVWSADCRASWWDAWLMTGVPWFWNLQLGNPCRWGFVQYMLQVWFHVCFVLHECPALICPVIDSMSFQFISLIMLRGGWRSCDAHNIARKNTLCHHIICGANCWHCVFRTQCWNATFHKPIESSDEVKAENVWLCDWGSAVFPT